MNKKLKVLIDNVLQDPLDEDLCDLVVEQLSAWLYRQIDNQLCDALNADLGEQLEY